MALVTRTYHLELSEKEAAVLGIVLGSINGAGEGRIITSALYDTLVDDHLIELSEDYRIGMKGQITFEG
jgi:hypothetical protein